MPTNVVHTAKDESKWNRAKAQAAKQGKGDNYAYVMSIYKNMGSSHDFKKESNFAAGYDRLMELAFPKSAQKKSRMQELLGLEAGQPASAYGGGANAATNALVRKAGQGQAAGMINFAVARNPGDRFLKRMQDSLAPIPNKNTKKAGVPTGGDPMNPAPEAPPGAPTIMGVPEPPSLSPEAIENLKRLGIFGLGAGAGALGHHLYQDRQPEPEYEIPPFFLL